MGYRIGIVGATGQVGVAVRHILLERELPIDEIRFFASARSAGRVLPFGDRDVTVEDAATGLTDISFTLPRADGQTAMSALARIQDEVGYDKLLYDDQVGKVSLIGAGMRSHPGITAKFFAALASAGVNIEMISTSEIRISVIVDEAQVDEAVRATHTAFDLDADEVEAVVYGGSGR